ncbi:hypothetical protein [Hoeflea olei]|uniref:Uncharacterized protein n=1 Tax=Hoeflea olei TaxID=1480615 RepID=A0A1C1YZS9_9HYPH|nr:hypothetical protein [Hoeflea olei]OCW58982.1 hypothetical protein AWJ14_04520 [Hoeflea olei]
MTYDAYRIVIEDDGEFDRAFTTYAMKRPHGASRLVMRLEAFAGNPQGQGEYLRGAGRLAFYVVPPRARLDADGEAGFLARVDDSDRSVCPVRFLAPDAKRRWSEHESWAERILGI